MEKESLTSRRERGRSLDERRWRKKSRRKRSRESRRHGSTSPRNGSADCDGGDNDDGNERSQAVKVRRKEQTREARRLRAALDGRDLDAERR